MLDLPKLCRQYAIEARGVIHVGAHEGSELSTYQKMGVQRVLFIEANPAVFERLQANVSDMSGVDVVNCAVSNHDGFVTLHITSQDQSSSILPLKVHKIVYPDIKETDQILVQSKRLDTLIEEMHIKPSDFNVLNIDIQGAELLAFEGSTDLLRHIEAINTEVNFEELYEGCALIDQIDKFLNVYGFERVATTTPHHPSWGDAFYIKKIRYKEPVITPVITMSTLGKNGRFGNQIFQYAFLKIYGRLHDLRIETPKWIGQYLFGHSDLPVSRQLPQVREETYNFAENLIPKSQTPLKNVDLVGYFQCHISYYASHKEYFRSLFQPTRKIETKMQEAVDRLYLKGKTIVGLHLRRGDYLHGYGQFFVTPNEWYKKWLQGIWVTLDEPVLFIASDDTEGVRNDFEEYEPLTSKDLKVKLPKAVFYPDFYLLSKCDIIAISNSSFSFAACMLNDKCNLFFRPHLPTKQLIPFDPWNSEILFEGIKNPKQIRNLLESETFEEADKALELALEIYPDSPDLLNIKGELMVQTGNIEEATKIFLDLKEKYPNHIETLNNIAIILCLEKNWDGAKKLLYKALKLSPSHKSVQENLMFVQNEIFMLKAKQFIQKGNIIEAKRILNQILSTDEQHIEALNQLAFIHVKSGNFGEAEKNLSLVLQIEPNNEEALQLVIEAPYGRNGWSIFKNNIMLKHLNDKPIAPNTINNSYPIIFIHKGNNDYLTYTLQCATAFNPDSQVILLGDKTNEQHKTLGIKHYFYEDYEGEESILFDEGFKYIHGENHHAPEWLVRFWFNRWFHIYFFIKQHNIDKFWTFDSDNLILCDLSGQVIKFKDYDCTEQCNGICMNGFIGNQEVVQGYIQKIIDLFNDEEYLDKQREAFKTYTDCSFTEMRAFAVYKESTPLKILRLNTIINGETFDDCIAQQHDMEMENGIKKLYFTDGSIYVKHLPTKQFIKANSLNMSWVPTSLIKDIYEYAMKNLLNGKIL